MDAELEVFQQGDFNQNPEPVELGMELAIPGSDGEPEKSCWICFATEEDNRRAKWVQPCRCRGTTKWVHQSCLYRWIDERQKGNFRRSVICQQCQTEYVIVFPPLNPVASMLEWVEQSVRWTCPYLATGAVLGSVYWTAITYGAITVVQVLGQQRGLELMENGTPLLVLVGLPIIPVALIATRLIRWEDAVLRALRSKYNILRKLPFFSWFSEPDDVIAAEELNGLPPLPPTMDASEPLYISRVFCGAMLLPTFATAMGNLFFKSLADPFHRSVVGGVTYIALKGLMKIYLRQKLYIRRKRRRIVDYTDENVRIYMGGELREAPPVEDQYGNRNPNRNPGSPRQFAGDDDPYDITSYSSSSSIELNEDDMPREDPYMPDFESVIVVRGDVEEEQE